MFPAVTLRRTCTHPLSTPMVACSAGLSCTPLFKCNTSSTGEQACLVQCLNGGPVFHRVDLTGPWSWASCVAPGLLLLARPWRGPGLYRPVFTHAWCCLGEVCSRGSAEPKQRSVCHLRVLAYPTPPPPNLERVQLAPTGSAWGSPLPLPPHQHPPDMLIQFSIFFLSPGLGPGVV